MHTAVLQSRDLILNWHNRSASLRGRQIKLAPKEFELLADLMSHRGQVRSRESLCRHLWGAPTNNLDIYIQTLRRKIEENPKTPKRILSHGSGYRFAD
jgi:two-component system alkaline phosphatase synthesis response regulator PhoP